MKTRADLREVFSSVNSAPMKTFVVEAHPKDEPAELLSKVVGAANMESTNDVYLWRVSVPEAEAYFWVDQLDDRYWSFHTDMPVGAANQFLRNKIGASRELDWTWLPSAHLRNVWPDAPIHGVRSKFEGAGFLGGTAAVDDVKLRLSGRSADVFFEYLYRNPQFKAAVPFDGVEVILDDPDLGYIHEAVDRMGRFMVSGDSLEFHMQFVQAVIGRYRNLVELCEQKSLRWNAFDREMVTSGGRLSGHPIVVKFSRQIPDLELFMTELMASREPFRMWGVPKIQDTFAEVDAVDLHVGQQLRIEVGERWMRIYLRDGACGNIVARLVSNLQHRFDGALTFADPQLQAALEGYDAVRLNGVSQN